MVSKKREYTVALYHVALGAPDSARTTWPISRGRFYQYLRHFCNSLTSDLLAVATANGIVHFLVKLNPNIALSEFVNTIKTQSSRFISGDNSTNAVEYWHKGFYIRPISPEDREQTVDMMQKAAENGIIPHPSYFGMIFCKDVIDIPKFCYHIIFTTINNSRKLPIKKGTVYHEAISRICEDLGGEMVVTDIRRNHVHLLCNVPTTASISVFVEEIKSRLLAWMHTAMYFKAVNGWSETIIAYTVSPTWQKQEEYDIYHQDYIHGKGANPNEMTHLYQKLDIPFLCSLV